MEFLDGIAAQHKFSLSASLCSCEHNIVEKHCAMLHENIADTSNKLDIRRSSSNRNNKITWWGPNWNPFDLHSFVYICCDISLQKLIDMMRNKQTKLFVRSPATTTTTTRRNNELSAAFSSYKSNVSRDPMQSCRCLSFCSALNEIPS